MSRDRAQKRTHILEGGCQQMSRDGAQKRTHILEDVGRQAGTGYKRELTS
jgi:hypothetical protein